uniref:Uncharacterized protein n=1 Tax=Eutreptiella gymnastica TaxID=73025 RepID=A0A7S4LFK6_9EUGL
MGMIQALSAIIQEDVGPGAQVQVETNSRAGRRNALPRYVHNIYGSTEACGPHEKKGGWVCLHVPVTQTNLCPEKVSQVCKYFSPRQAEEGAEVPGSPVWQKPQFGSIASV